MQTNSKYFETFNKKTIYSKQNCRNTRHIPKANVDDIIIPSTSILIPHIVSILFIQKKKSKYKNKYFINAFED